jgi:hypothetical protein
VRSRFILAVTKAAKVARPASPLRMATEGFNASKKGGNWEQKYVEKWPPSKLDFSIQVLYFHAANGFGTTKIVF